jgi:sugar phosphate permease
MVWKVFWGTLRGDGTLPSSFAPRTVRSDLDRLFYIEGALTIFTALVAAFVLPDFPSTSHGWLSPIEVRLAEKRMEEDASVGDEGQTEVKSQRIILVGALTDWKVIYMALKYVILRIPRERVNLSTA